MPEYYMVVVTWWGTPKTGLIIIGGQNYKTNLPGYHFTISDVRRSQGNIQVQKGKNARNN